MSDSNILNRAFSKTAFMDLINSKDSIIYSIIVKRYICDENILDNNQLISEIYKVMQKEYRNEYIYKNTMLNKLLLGRHSLNTTTALTEVSVGKAKADFILINGMAVVYEIKTELDSLDRLKDQLENYYKAFPNVYVVTNEIHLEKVKKQLWGSDVGICTLTKRNTISEKKKANSNYSSLDYEVMFKILRKIEYEELLIKVFGELPKTTPVKYYSTCFTMFKGLSLIDAYNEVVKILKKRNKVIVEEFKNVVPKELSSLIYFSDFKESDYRILQEFLTDEYRGL